jgi:hypothetical protein
MEFLSGAAAARDLEGRLERIEELLKRIVDRA